MGIEVSWRTLNSKQNTAKILLRKYSMSHSDTLNITTTYNNVCRIIHLYVCIATVIIITKLIGDLNGGKSCDLLIMVS